MAHPDAGVRDRPGLPAQASVLAEKVLVPARRPAVPGARTSPSGPNATYRILRTSEVDRYDKPLSAAEVPTLGLQRFARAGETFRGKARKAAKTSIADAETEFFDDLQELVASLPSEGHMTSRQPPITTDQSSGRVDEESRNVRVRAFLYAASRENDNDFHLIVGRDPDSAPSMYMTMEISGLPPSGSGNFARLKGARDAYKTFFGSDLPGASYDFYDPPVPIEVEGSLFFDMSHGTGSRPGPASLRDDMPTVWEIHPISDIVLEP